MWCLILCIAAFWLGYIAGCVQTHQVIADECDRLGGFYVGDKTYACKRVTKDQP